MENYSSRSAGTDHQNTTGAPAGIGVPEFASYEDAAHWWLDFGLTPIPALPEQKRSSVRWDDWLTNLSHESIERYWAQHPDHEVGIIVGDKLIVFDSDTPESRAAIIELEQRHGVTPGLIVETRHGVHHYFALEHGTFARSDSHDSIKSPSGIDVKTGRAFVMIAPSTNKRVVVCDAASATDLARVNQAVVDAVAIHNGRQPPRAHEVALPGPLEPPPSSNLAHVSALLDMLDPDCGYEDWLHVGMAVFHETGGSSDGLALFDRWSGGGRKYGGPREIETKWKSFRPDQPNPVTIATLRRMVSAAGHDWVEACAATEPDFDVCAYEVAPAQAIKSGPATVLDRYSLKGRSRELQRLAIEQVPVLGNLALKGQATAIYAAPNTGKTLIVLHLLIEAINAGRINPARLYYLNMDDTHRGILEKTEIAEEFGFHVLAEGHRDFSAGKFLADVECMIANGQARDVIVVLDTLKKFTNLMDKARASQFTKVARRLVMQGATVIALAHTNKNLGSDGKPRYGGTSDIVDDFDCAYTVAVVTPRDEAGCKVIEFENFKRRGFVAETAAYKYDATAHDSYLELLLSVEQVDPEKVVSLRQAEQQRTDAELIDAITICIRDEIDTRMRIAKEVMKNTGASRRRVLDVMDRYAGDDPLQHHWRFAIGARGAWVYTPLDEDATDDTVPIVTF